MFALFTAFVWGTTFVVSKVVLQNGISPAEMMLCRFIIGYACMWVLYPHWHSIHLNITECLFALVGITGGSLYFYLEYTALLHTNATNVGLICATVPILTAVFESVFCKTKHFNWPIVIGSILAFSGVAIVIFNGQFNYQINLLGDLFALGAAICWVLYSLILQKIGNQYSEFYITRKLFFYSIITIVPFFAFVDTGDMSNVFAKTEVWLSLVYLGVFASSICLCLWNKAINKIGALMTNNYLYLLPTLTVITCSIILKEKVTVYVITGTVLITSGICVFYKYQR